MATIGDLRDIMQVKDGQNDAPVPAKKKRAPRPKRQDLGISRELYALMGDNAPPVTLALPKMKEKPRMQRKVQHWEIRAFSNAARKDNLQLSHWIPKATPADEPYRFAAFNTAPSPNLFTYTADEYNRLLKSDTDWTREETDYLFNMCRHYDLRFIVIHDRWAWKTTPNRTLEDLKERYYGCCKKLVQNRPTNDENAKTSNASQFSFDKNREVTRKKYLRSLMQRTPAQIAEEEQLYVESRRLEQTYTRVSRERDELLRMLAGPGSGPGLGGSGATAPGAATKAAGINAAASSSSNTLSRSRRGGRTQDEESMSNVSASGGKMGGKGGKSKQQPVDPEFDKLHNITRFDIAQGPGTNAFGLPKAASANSSGVYLRSLRMPVAKPAMQVKVAAVLQEIHISPKLVMPTRANGEKLEALMSAVNTLVELKKQVDRAEYELAVATNRTVPATKDGDFAIPEDVADSGTDRNKRSMSVSTTTSEQRPTKRRKK